MNDNKNILYAMVGAIGIILGSYILMMFSASYIRLPIIFIIVEGILNLVAIFLIFLSVKLILNFFKSLKSKKSE